MEDNASTFETIIPEKAQKQFEKVKAQVKASSERFEQRNRVSTSTMVLMICVALLYDGAQFLLNLIPFVGWVFSSLVGIYAWLTFYVWTSVKGWGKTDTLKKWLVQGLRAWGVIPVANTIPEITIGVILSILIVKSDDFIYNRTKGKLDSEIIKEGWQFFNIFRDVYK
jgi:hypothetical protein